MGGIPALFFKEKLSVSWFPATIGNFFFIMSYRNVVRLRLQYQLSKLFLFNIATCGSRTTRLKWSLRKLPKFVERKLLTLIIWFIVQKLRGFWKKSAKDGAQVCGEATFAAAGLTLAVLVIARGRNGKRYLSSILLVTGLALFSSPFCVCRPILN